MLPWILEQALTIFVLFTCIRCSFVITSDAASNGVAAAPANRLYRRAPIPNIGVNIPQPVPIINEESCPILSSETLPIVLISTIDGSLHCINKKTGKLLWSQKGFLEPLVTSHYSKPPAVDWDNIDDSLLESDEQLMTKTGFIPETLFMTEPAKQGLIYFLHPKDGKGIIQKSKASFKDLIEKAPLTWNNRIYLGSKKTHYFALDHNTGEIVEEFDENNYMTYRSGKPKGLKKPLLMIGRIDYQLKIHDYDSKHLIANITYRDYVSDFFSSLISTDSFPEPEEITISPDIFDHPIVSVFEVLLNDSEDSSQCVTRKLPLATTVRRSFQRTQKKQKKKTSQDYYIGVLDNIPYVMSQENFPYITDSKFMDIYKAAGGLDSKADSLIPKGEMPITWEIEETPAIDPSNITPLLPHSDSEPNQKSPVYSLPLASFEKLILFIFSFGVFLGWSFNKARAAYFKYVTPPSPTDIKKKTKKIKAKPLPPSIKTLSDGSTVINSLTVSNNAIGYGSHGTIVYKGKFQNRDVAVKRMLIDLYHIGEREVRSLQESDDHPNVIRYYCMEQNDKFLYLGLELCPMSLHGLIEGPRHPDFSMEISQTEMLYQMMSGLNHLHSLKIVHRDIKPQNILVSLKKDRQGKPPSVKLLISDFGLSKRLDDDQSSFHNTIHSGGTGTAGWRAPECLLNLPGGIDAIGSGDDNSYSFSSSSAENIENPAELNTNRIKLSRAIDIFSMGCVFYYVLSNGQHPFGNRFVRESRIIEGKFDLSALINDTVENKNEAYDLIEQMISSDPKDRPTSSQLLIHPYFWSASKKLNFLQDVSDRLEGESRDPPSPLLQTLEGLSVEVLGDSWYHQLDKCILNDLKRFRGYDGTRIQDLLRVVRNKKNHYNDLSPYVKKTFGSLPDEYLNYFTSRFPQLLLHAYYVVSLDPEIREEKRFQPYFETHREN